MYTGQQRLLAAMSFNSYRPSEENRFEIEAAGWHILTALSRPDRGDGFDATVFRSNTGEIVIAFRGTDGDSFLGNATDWDDNILIAKGAGDEQVEHALEVVADVMKAYPGANIAFTGHSLGGGLASLMAWCPPRSDPHVPHAV